MLSCWRVNPESRPLFDNLVAIIFAMLDDENLAKHYINVNKEYLESNTTKFTINRIDYSPLMGVPDCCAPSIDQKNTLK